MPGTSTYFGNAILNFMRGQAMPAPPSAVYVALFNGDPESGGTEVTSTIRTAGRVAGTFSAPTSKKIVNTGDIEFGASAGQATITHVALMDAATGGNILIPKQISAQRQVAQGDPVRYPSGNLSIQL